MWPWGHLAVGYLCYIGVLRIRGREQTSRSLLAMALGTQLPDVVDKPLAWTFGVLPSGRSFAHSVLVATVAITFVYLIAKRRNRDETAIAFSIAYISHILVDIGPTVVWGLVHGDWSQLKWTTYLLWPVLSAPPYPHDESFAQHLTGFVLDPYIMIQLGLFGIAIAVWIQTNAPGTAWLRRMESKTN